MWNAGTLPNIHLEKNSDVRNNQDVLSFFSWKFYHDTSHSAVKGRPGVGPLCVQPT